MSGRLGFHSSTCSVDDGTPAKEFIEWLQKEFERVPKHLREQATMDVRGMLHMPTDDRPINLTVMVGIQYPTKPGG